MDEGNDEDTSYKEIPLPGKFFAPYFTVHTKDNGMTGTVHSNQEGCNFAKDYCKGMSRNQFSRHLPEHGINLETKQVTEEEKKIVHFFIHHQVPLSAINCNCFQTLLTQTYTIEDIPCSDTNSNRFLKRESNVY